MSELEEALSGMVSQEELQHIIRVEADGLHVGAKDYPCEVHVTSSSVDILFGSVKYASFALNHVRFGDYRLGLAEDGGLAFMPT